MSGQQCRLPTRLIGLFLLTVMLFAQGVPIAVADTIFLPVVQTDATGIAAATSGLSGVIVRLAPNVTIDQLQQDYPFTVEGTIPALALYYLGGIDQLLRDQLTQDARVLSVEADDQFASFEVQQHVFAGTDSIFQALQRYFGSGSGDSAALQRLIEKAAKKSRLKKPFVNQLEQVLVTPAGQALNAEWQTWGEESVRLNKALKRYDGTGIIVAVLDTGAATTHPSLMAHLLPGYDFVENDFFPEDAPNGLDDDNDGLFDEGTGHGTHIAGIIATIAPQAKILPVRVLNSDGGGTLFDIVQGVLFAVDNGAQVINLSLSTISDSPILAAAIRYALDRHVLVVAAASGDETGLDYPAAYDQVIAVGAISKDNYVSTYSASYASMVDVMAPGDYIYSTYYNNNFAWWSGTSMAAPFVAGEAALLLSSGRCPVACTQDLIINKVDPVSKTKGVGRINLEKATKAVR